MSEVEDKRVGQRRKAMESHTLQRCKAGEIEAFNDLINQYQQKVYNIAYRMMGNEHDASDLAQESLIKVFHSIGFYKEQCTLSTWIYRITMNTCLDELRKKNTMNKHITYTDSFFNLEDGSPSPEERILNREKNVYIQKAILQLREDYRAVIVLRDVHGFSYEEIGEILETSLGTVKSRISRARKQLKETLLNSKLLHINEGRV